jgi:hypothetical protein
VGGTEQRDDLIDEAEIIAREHAERIADDIIEATLGEIELDVIGFLLGTLLVEGAPRHEHGFSRILPGAPGRGLHLRRGRCARCGCSGSCGGLRCRYLVQLLK